MLTKRWWLAIGAAVLAAAGLAIGVSLALTSGGSGAQRQPSHADYKQLFAETHVGDRKEDVLGRWPEPYQHYADNLKDDCYEWNDVPVDRYTTLKEGTGK